MTDERILFDRRLLRKRRARFAHEVGQREFLIAHVAREIALPWREEGVHAIGFPGCYPNPYAERMMEQLCTHPNVGAVLLVSLGCESFNKYALERAVRATGRNNPRTM